MVFITDLLRYKQQKAGVFIKRTCVLLTTHIDIKLYFVVKRMFLYQLKTIRKVTVMETGKLNYILEPGILLRK